MKTWGCRGVDHGEAGGNEISRCCPHLGWRSAVGCGTRCQVNSDVSWVQHTAQTEQGQRGRARWYKMGRSRAGRAGSSPTHWAGSSRSFHDASLGSRTLAGQARNHFCSGSTMRARLLQAALVHVPTHGFTQTAIAAAARDLALTETTATVLLPSKAGFNEELLKHWERSTMPRVALVGLGKEALVARLQANEHAMPALQAAFLPVRPSTSARFARHVQRVPSELCWEDARLQGVRVADFFDAQPEESILGSLVPAANSHVGRIRHCEWVALALSFAEANFFSQCRPSCETTRLASV
jgi:hypothetical protein